MDSNMCVNSYWGWRGLKKKNHHDKFSVGLGVTLVAFLPSKRMILIYKCACMSYSVRVSLREIWYNTFTWRPISM